MSSPLRVQLALPVAFALEIVDWSALYVIWQILYFTAIAVREYRSAQLKQSETARALHLAELRLLKSQLNPHFLFNALNTVRSLIADNPARAQNAVTHLANTLRYTLSSRQDELVTLSQELDIVADYLQLESMRFEDRLRIEIDVRDDAAAVRIPMMLLQTLVENAIKHGIAELPAGGLLRISASVQNQIFTLEVENPRPAAQIPATHESVGLRNARDRLRLLFGGRASLELDLSKAGVAIARLQDPGEPMRAMVIDDEPPARRELRRLLKDFALGGGGRRGRQCGSSGGNRSHRAHPGPAVSGYSNARGHRLRSAQPPR